MSIAELSAAIKRREPRLASVPDEELVRKVLERRPELMSMINTSEKRRPLDLYGKVGSRLKQNLDLPSQAQGAATAIHEGLRNIREHGPSKMPEFLAALKQYAKPENVVGDALTAFILGQGGGKPTSPTAPPEGAYGMPPAQARALPLEANLLETMIKARAKEMAAKYPVPQWQRIQDPFAAPARSQLAAFTPEAIDWHNTALNQAKQKLGPGADIGSVLQLAAKIQQAGK